MNVLRFFPHFLIFSYLIRLLITGASFGDALVMVVLGCLVAGRGYLDHIKEPEANKDIKEQLKKLEETQESIKSKVSSLSLGNTFKR